METVTVYKVNDDLTISLTALPGFRKLGSVVILDEKKERVNKVNVYYVGGFFGDKLDSSSFSMMRVQILKLTHTHMLKKGLGNSTGRLNLSLVLRERAKEFV